LPDIPRKLEVACYAALPAVFIETKSIDDLQGVYELDLQRYVSWYCQWDGHSHPQHVENVATFFRWMELKVRFEVIAYITPEMIIYLVPPQLSTRLIPSSSSRHRPLDLSSGFVACSMGPSKSDLSVDQPLDTLNGEGSSGGSWLGSSRFEDSVHYHAGFRIYGV